MRQWPLQFRMTGIGNDLSMPAARSLTRLRMLSCGFCKRTRVRSIRVWRGQAALLRRLSSLTFPTQPFVCYRKRMPRLPTPTEIEFGLIAFIMAVGAVYMVVRGFFALVG